MEALGQDVDEEAADELRYRQGHGLVQITVFDPVVLPLEDDLLVVEGDLPGERGDVSVANSYSRGDREFEKATAMLCPSEIAQRGRVRNHTAAPFRRRVSV